MKKGKIERVITVSDDERWFEIDIYIDCVWVRTIKRWKRIQ